MKINTIHPMHVLCFETETNFRDIFQYVRFVAHRLYKEAVKNDVEITGPVYWIYEGADGQPDTTFKLTIALPVYYKEYELAGSEFKLKTLDSFSCVSRQHPGDWNKLGETYGQMITEIQADNFPMSGQNREIYLNMDFENPVRNITEVQIGVVQK
ncbi:GyrI-like domain-containing protein [Dyadobacter sp. NIV53]|uniref:GyrI-like domain-containing protein n=1 Tax=Dyadobacter sp. NIV53 TaxID=2861765 RepID=UPI001C88CD0D|nr:GyrI-like domain-containing protein [Dyadobacter sp. NIV53]